MSSSGRSSRSTSLPAMTPQRRTALVSIGAAAALAGLKLGTGRWREVHPAVWLVAGLFILRYALA